MSDIRIFEIYRYDPDVDAAPRMQRYELELTGERMLLDALISLKKQDETISYRRSCREGVCGSDAMNINGKNGLACLTKVATTAKNIPEAESMFPRRAVTGEPKNFNPKANRTELMM